MMTTQVRRKARTGALLLPALLLSACFQNPAPAPAPLPVNPPAADSPTGSAERTAPLHPLGLLDVTFSGLKEDGTMQVTARPSALLGASGLTDQGSIQLKALSNGTFTTGKRGVNGVRYLYATFAVRNANAAGTAYATPRQNLTLVAASTAATVPGTPYSKVLRFDGSDAAASIAPTILPTAGVTFNRQTEAPALLPGAEDLQVFAESEVAPLATGTITRAFPFGYVVRHSTNTASRTLAASPAANQYDGIVTVALKLPLQATVAEDPFTFNMTFAVVDDSVNRVTESLEEQAAGTVQARATALGAGTQVALLCGSTYSGTNALFIGSVTTAGTGTNRDAHIGGDVALKTLPTAYSAIGNVNLVAPVNNGLGQFYSAYPTTPGGAAATLAFTGTSTSRGGNVAVAPSGSFTYVSKAGDGSPAVTDNLNYTVSDGRGCTSPTQTAPINVSGRVWFAKDNASAGDGRQGTPFNTLSALQTAAQTGETMYLFRGSGSISGGLTLKNNQTLIGEGSALTYNATTILPAGASPSLVNNAAGAGLTLASGNTIKGLSVTGTSAGITGSSFGTLSADLDTVTASAGNALSLSSGTVSGTIKTVNATNTAANGFGVNLVGVGGTLSVTGTGSAGSGGTVQASGTGGVGYNVQPGAANLTLSLNRLQMLNNAAAGLLFKTVSTDTGSLNLTFQNSTFNENATNSIQLNPAGSGSNLFTISGNTFTHTSQGGSVFYSSAGRTAVVTDHGHITGNTVTLGTSGLATSNGIQVDQYGPGSARFEISGNTVNAFGTYGIKVSSQGNTTANSGGRLDALITNNIVSSPAGNGLEGIHVLIGGAINEANTVCLRLTGNNSQGAGGTTAGVYLRQRTGNTFQINGYTGNSDSTGATNYVTANNTVNFVRISTATGTTMTPVPATCNVPN